MNTELETQLAIRRQLIDKNQALMDEINVLSKIVQSSQRHFEAVRGQDFATLKKQLEEYEAKVKGFKVTAKEMKEFTLKRAKKVLAQNQTEYNKMSYNDEAKKRRFPLNTQLNAIQTLEQLASDKKASKYLEVKKETHKKKIEDIIIKRAEQL